MVKALVSGPDWTSNPDMRVRFPSPAPRKREEAMAKYLYHLPQKKVQIFLSKYESLFLKILKDREMFVYHKNFGKSFYALHVREFLKAYKIDRDFTFANRSFNHLLEESFLKNFYGLLGLKRYKSVYGNQKELFFIFVYLLEAKDKALADIFIQKVFTHFFTLIPKPQKKTISKWQNPSAKQEGLL